MEIQNINQHPQRPSVLTFLLILTFIGSGMTFFSNSVIYIMFDQFKAVFSQHPDMEMMGVKMNMAEYMNLNPLFYLLQGLLSGLAFAGAVFMWNLKKVGFHLYTTAQILMLIIPKIFIHHLPFPLFPLIISFLFIYLYYKFIKIMK